jgi:hypothetical protein
MLDSVEATASGRLRAGDELEEIYTGSRMTPPDG